MTKKNRSGSGTQPGGMMARHRQSVGAGVHADQITQSPDLATLQLVLSSRSIPEVIHPLWNIFENIQVAIAYLDVEGKFIQVNRAFADSLGKSPEELNGTNVFDLNPDPKSRELFEQAVQEGRSFSAFNLPSFNPQFPERGTTYWNWTLNPLFDTDGTVTGILFTANEVTSRVRVEKSLKESQALFELIFESAPDANILLDEQGIIVAMNHQAENMFGYRRAEIIGQTIEMLLPERFHETYIQQRDVYLSNPQIRTIERSSPLSGLRKDGQELPLTITLSPLKTESGTLVLCVIRDLTEFQRREHEIRTNEARFHAIFDNAAIGIQLLDSDGSLLETNPAMQNMLGYTGEELMGMHFPEFTFEGDINRNLELFRALLAGKIDRYRMEKRYLRKDGSIFWGRLNVSRYKANPDEPPFVIVMVEDITELKQAEAALRSSEERFRSSVETMVDGFAILSAVRDNRGQIVDFRYDYINDAGSALNQRSREETVGHTLLEILPIHAENGLLQKYIDLVERGDPLLLEAFDFENHYQDGKRRRIAYDIQAVKMGDGLAVSWRDITPRKLAEESLRQQERLLRRVVETLPVGVWITDRDGSILFGNQAGQRIWGTAGTENGFVGVEKYKDFKGWWVSTGEPVRHEDWAVQRALRNGETVIEDELVVLTLDGKEKIILNSAAPIFDEEGRIAGAVIVNQDITERKQMQAELAEVQHKLLRQAEEERLALARDMHDGPIQDLYGVSFLLDELEHAQSGDQAAEVMEKARSTVRQTITTLRGIMSDLRPPTLAPFGLERTIRSYAEQYQQLYPEINLHLNLMKDGQKLPESHRLALFRILQEALNNIRRHAQAKNVFINFTLDDEVALLTVEDDGVGFEVPNHWVKLAREGHYGLVGMRERAEALGGHMELISTPGQGTLYQVTVPVNRVEAG